MMDPSHQPGLAASHSHDDEGKDNSWIGFSDMEKSSFTSLMTLFSLSTSFLSHPLTVLSVRQQASSSLIREAQQIRNVGVVVGLRHSMSTVGMQGMFRGWLPIATMGVPSDVQYYAIFESSREMLLREVKTMHPRISHGMLDFLQALGSSALATFVSRIPYVPAEVISSKLIVQGKAGVGMLEMMRSVFRQEGVRGFYKGFSSSYLVGVISSTQWWWAYTTCRRYASQHQLSRDYPVVSDSLSGFVSGFSAVLVSHPFDTLKTRIMTASSSLAPPQQALSFHIALQDVLSKYGWRGLYRGLPASLYQTAWGSTLFAASYELIKLSSTSQPILS